MMRDLEEIKKEKIRKIKAIVRRKIQSENYGDFRLLHKGGRKGKERP